MAGEVSLIVEARGTRQANYPARSIQRARSSSSGRRPDRPWVPSRMPLSYFRPDLDEIADCAVSASTQRHLDSEMPSDSGIRPGCDRPRLEAFLPQRLQRHIQRRTPYLNAVNVYGSHFERTSEGPPSAANICAICSAIDSRTNTGG